MRVCVTVNEFLPLYRRKRSYIIRAFHNGTGIRKKHFSYILFGLTLRKKQDGISFSCGFFAIQDAHPLS